MKKLLIILGIIVLIIVIGIGALFYGIKSYLTPEKISALITERLETAIHHKVKLGPISTGFTSARIDGFTLLPNNPKETIPLAKVKTVSLSFSLIPLLKKRLEIGKVVIDSPEIHAVREKDGKLNWQTEFKKVSFNVKTPTPVRLSDFSLIREAFAAEETKAASKGFVVQVGRVEIRNGTLLWEDHTLSPAYKAKITELQLDVSHFSLDSPFDFDLKGILKREKASDFSAKGTLDLGKKDLKGTILLSSVWFPDLSPYLKGRDVKLLSGTGNLDMKVVSARFETWKVDGKLEVKDVSLESQGRKVEKLVASLQTEANLDLKKDHLSIKSLKGKVADSDFRLNGEVDKLRTAPTGTLQFESDKMDIDTLMGLFGLFGKASEKGERKSDKETEAGKVPSPSKKSPQGKKRPPALPNLTLNAKIRLLIVKKLKIEEIETKVVTRGHIIVCDPFTAKLYGGTVKGKLNVRFRGGIPVIEKEISIKNVDVAPLLSDLNPGMKEKFTGCFFGNGRFQGVIGAASTYQGDIGFHVEKGSMQGIAFLNIAAAIMKLPSLAHLEFETLKGKATIGNNKIKIISTEAKGRDVSLDANGDIGFDKKLNLDAMLILPYKVVRKALGKRSDLFKDKTDTSGRKWSLIPIRAKGNLDKPRVTVKFEKAAVDKIINKNIHDKKIRKLLKGLFN